MDWVNLMMCSIFHDKHLLNDHNQMISGERGKEGEREGEREGKRGGGRERE